MNKRGMLWAFLMSLIIFNLTSCDKASTEEPIAPEITKPELSEQIKLVFPELEIIQSEEVENTNWKSVSWKSSAYDGKNLTNERNDFSNIEEELKLLTYTIKGGKFIVSSTSAAKAAKTDTSFDFTWSANGEITIEGIKLWAKKENEKLVIFYDYKDIATVKKIFQIELTDFTASEESKTINYMGIIHFDKIEIPIEPPVLDKLCEAGEVANLIIKRGAINGLSVSVLGRNDPSKIDEVQVTGRYANQSILKVRQPFDFSTYEFSRGKEIFESFFNQTKYTFRGIPINISSISMNGKTIMAIGSLDDGYLCSFIFGIYMDFGTWLTPPLLTIETPLNAIDVAKSIMFETQIDGESINAVKYHATDNNRFYLCSGTNLLRDISVNSPINLDEIKDTYARTIFTKFFERKTLQFEATTVTIRRVILHEANVLTVEGNNSENDPVVLEYNFVTKKGKLNS